MKRIITCITLTLTAFFTGSLLGQEDNSDATVLSGFGRIAGKVVNAETGEAVSKASVALLQDAAYFVRTDLEGRYLFTDVPAGTYTVRIFKSGFQPSDVTGVDVRDGEVFQVDIPLAKRKAPASKTAQSESSGSETSGQSDIFELAAFEVTAEQIKNTEVGLLELRQQSVTIGDAIGADFLARTGVSDVAQAMTKVVGASVVAGKYVLIRGLGDRYSNTLLNGVSMPSADPDKRAVQMDQFPSDLMESIVTTKSFTPDQPGSFSGGILNMKTQSFPVQFFFNVGSSIAVNTQTTNAEVFSIPGGRHDWLAMDDGSRALPKDLPENFPVPTLVRLRARTGNLEPAETFEKVNNAFDNRSYYPTKKQARPSGGFNFSVGDQVTIGKKLLGYVFSFTYDNDISHYDGGSAGRYLLGSNDPESEGFIDNLLVFDGLDSLTYKDTYLENPNYLDENPAFGVSQTSSEVSWGSFGQISLRLSDQHEMGFNIFYNQSAEEEIKRGLGESTRSDTGRIYERVTIDYTERNVASYQLRGKSLFSEWGDLRVDWRISYSLSTLDQPDYRSLFSFWDINNGSFASSNGRNSRYFRNLDEDNTEGAVDFTFPFTWRDSLNGKLKFGFLYSEGGRTYEGDSFAYANLISTEEERNNFPNPIGIISQNGTQFIFGNYLERVGVNPDYEAIQEIRAAYLMTDLEMTDSLKFVFGVRIEETYLETIPEFALSQPSQIDQQDILPAFSAIYAYSSKVNIKFAYGRTIARPIYKEITDSRIEDDFLDTFFSGNPELQLSVIDNVDLRWEWFPRSGEIIAASIFYKELAKPIELIFNGEIGAIQPQNRDSGKLYGFEFEYRRNLGIWFESLKGFNLGFNFSIIESKVTIGEEELVLIRDIFPEASGTRELLGQSPYTLNIDLSWTNEPNKMTASLLYNVIGERLDLVNYGPLPDVYEQPSPTLDFIISKGFADHWKIKFSAKNLLDSKREKIISHQGESYNYETYKRGRSFSLSLSYSH